MPVRARIPVALSTRSAVAAKGVSGGGRVRALSTLSSEHRTGPLHSTMAPRDNRPQTRKNSTSSLYQADPNAPPMLRFQQSLPHLPVPTLSSTLSKYLETTLPHFPQSTPEHARTSAAVASFEASSLSKALQDRLEARAKEPGVENWLADWWDDVAYMSYRDPVVVYVSYFYVHKDGKGLGGRGDVGGGAERAARLVKALLPFRALVESGQLEPEKVRNTPLCMASYKWMFNASRYPTKPSDSAQKFDPSTHNHVVFVRKNKFYEVDVVQDGQELSLSELENQIRQIYETAGDTLGTPIGALTAENRDIWTDARDHLVANPTNAESLKRIESAIAVICLDDSKPVTREDVSWACWTGNGRNRFYDKHQFIVFDNGRSGFLGEHSCMDGTPTLRLNEYILASLAANRVDFGPEEVQGNLKAPRELKFELDAKANEYVQDAEKHFDELVGKHDLKVLHYEGYGKNLIKKFRASPDAWAQLVKQLAFHKLEGRPGICYESAQTRKFKRGRTEVIRSASVESKEWAEAMLDPKQSDTHRATLFRRAVVRHLQYAAWAADGQGVDRHLFGLKRLLRDGEELPEIYKDPAFARTSHWELSTSQLSSPFLDGWGYGEVVPDGYGVSYSIGDDYIRWTITSLKLRTEELRHYIAEAATETREMMERANKEAEKAAEQEKSKL